MAGLDKTPVVVGVDPKTGSEELVVERRFLRYTVFIVEEIIQIWYYEYYEVNGMEVEKTPEKYYVMKDLKVGDIVNDGYIMTEDYNGFTDSLPLTIEELINSKTGLSSIPIGAESGYVKIS